jgi:NADH:ubiquinone oxidoreductase subunit 6 (subunit J)
VQVLVYMGAIVILIIFAIMLTRGVMGARETSNSRWAIGLAVSVVAFVIVAFVLFMAGNNGLFSVQSPTIALDLNSDYWKNAVANLGKSLVDIGQYALPFELASLLLTGAMIGAIVIAREEII